MNLRPLHYGLLITLLVLSGIFVLGGVFGDFIQNYATAWGWLRGSSANTLIADLIPQCCPNVGAGVVPFRQTAHPPFTTLITLPFALMPWMVARIVHALLGWVCIFVSWRLLKISVWDAAATLFVWVLALAQGVWEPYIFLLLTLALVLSKERSFWAGVCVGVAGAIKIYPLLTALIWIRQRNWYALVGVGVAFALAGLMSELVLGFGSTRDWLSYLPNNTMLYLYQRINLSPFKFVPAVANYVPLLMALITFALLIPRRAEKLDLGQLMPAILLASPLIWPHYLGLLGLSPQARIVRFLLFGAGAVSVLAFLVPEVMEAVPVIATADTLALVISFWIFLIKPLRVEWVSSKAA